MPDQRIDPLDDEGTQYLIVMQMLRDDHPQRWSHAELERELYDIEPAVIRAALERLRDQGVVGLEGEQAWATACTRHLDALGMICI
jgi:hypothetical protein